MNAEDEPRGRRALGSFVWSGIARATRTVGRFLAFVCVARLFPLEQAGLFAFLLAIGSAAAICADLGLTDKLTRDIPATGFRAWSLERQAIRLRISTLPCGAGVAWLGLVVFDPQVGWADLGTLAFASAVTTADFLAALRRARGRYDLEALDTSLAALVPLALAGTAAAMGATFDTFQLILGLSATSLVVLRLSSRYGSLPADELAPTSFRSLTWTSRWFLLKAIGVWSMIEIALVVLRLRAGTAALAIYAAAARLTGLMTFPYVVLVFVFLPSLAHDARQGRDHLDASVKQLNLLALLLAHATYAGAMLAAEFVVVGLFGSSYQPALPVFRVLALAMLVLIGSPTASPLVAIGRERALSLLTMTTAVALGIGVFLLAPTRGSEGAALATLIVYGLSTLGMLALYLKNALPLFDPRYLATLVYVGAWLALYRLTNGWLTIGVLVAGCLLSGLAFCLLLLRTALFTRLTEQAPTKSEPR